MTMAFDTHSNLDRPVHIDATERHLGNGVAADFSIQVEPAHAVIRLEMGGFFGRNDVLALQRGMEDAVTMLACGPNQHLTLCDVRAMKIQSQEIVSAFAQIVGSSTLCSKRLAFVTGSSLARLQTRRLTDRPGVAFFSDLQAAEAWLLREDH